MQILFLSQLLPFPPDTGAKVRSYLVLRYLTKFHRVTLVAFTRPDDQPEAIEHLKQICEAVYTIPITRNRIRDVEFLALSMITGRSFTIERDHVPEMYTKIIELVDSKAFEAVHADQLWMAKYAIWAKSRKAGIRLVLDEHNACFQIIQRLANSERNPIKRIILEREWRALRQFEIQACAQFDRIITVTQGDQVILSNMLTDKGIKQKDIKFTTIPICVDTSEILPIKPSGNSYNVFHLGTMFYTPNIKGMLWFANEVWPLVLSRLPEASLTIAGKNPPSEIQELSTSDHGNTHILVTGYLPDPRAYLEKAGVFIVPLLAGGGMRVKIVDAWRWGLPIVSTSIGAEGIEYRDGENIMIADGAEAFTRAVMQVLCEPDLAQRLRENGRRWVEDHFDWQEVYHAWDRVYE